MGQLVYELLPRRLPRVAEPERLVRVQRAGNYVRLMELQRRTRTLEVAGYTSAAMSLGFGEQARRLLVTCVTAEYFNALGVRPIAGRSFSIADERTAEAAVVLGHGLWKSAFGAKNSVVGTSVTLSGRRFEAIGVAPVGFTGIDVEPADAWILLRAFPTGCSFNGMDLLASFTGTWLTTIGRIRPSYGYSDAEMELRSFAVELREPDTISSTPHGPELVPVLGFVTSQRSRDTRVALWLAGGAALVLLIACANVSCLLTVRGAARRRELAIRSQLGATRSRLTRQLTAEYGVLAVASGGAAWLCAVWFISALAGVLPAAEQSSPLNGRMFFAAMLIAVVSIGVAGFAPAVRLSRVSLSAPAGPGQSRIVRAIVVLQVALAVVLSATALLFMRSLDQVRSNLGYDMDRVVVAAVDLETVHGWSASETQQMFELLKERVRALPVVETASVSQDPLLGLQGATRLMSLRASAGQQGTFKTVNVVSTEYFDTLGTRVTKGRSFNSRDNALSAPVTIVSARAAQEVWPDANPVGQCAIIGRDLCAEVIGISEPRRNQSILSVDSEFFVPVEQAALYELPAAPRFLLVRTKPPAKEAIRAVASAVRGTSARLPFVDVRPLDDLASVQARSWIVGAASFSVFGAIAVLLASVGIYGMVATMVRGRTHELAVRLALGATHRHLLASVGVYALATVAVGCVAGIAATVAMDRLIRHLLFNVSTTEPSISLAACAVMMVVGIGGCVAPAARVLRLDPSRVLRLES